MSDEEQLHALLALYERRRDQGQDITVEELCRGAPHLRERVAREIAELETVEDLLNQYEELRERRQQVSAETLCRNHPHLVSRVAREIALLEKADQFLREPPAVELPVRVARFRLDSLLAEGGLGQVYIAWDDELKRKVAVKRLRNGFDPGSLSRFLQEAELTAALDHPGVVPVYGQVTDDQQQPYYAMRLIESENLDSAIARFHETFPDGRLALRRESALKGLIRGFLAVCQTIAYAHSKHIIHRDLKPANIMVGSYGETLVVDWGLAKRLGEVEAAAGLTLENTRAWVARTVAGTIKGSPAYMSPEQAEGNVSSIGPAVDVFGLGATLYKILTGRPPFASGANLLEKIRQGEFPRPTAVRRDVPPALEAICLKAMQRRAEDRYASAAALAEDVERWLADEPPRVYAEPTSAAVGRWLRRHSSAAMTAAAGISLLLLVLLAASALLLAAHQAAVAARSKAEQAEASALAARDKATRNLERTIEVVGRFVEISDARFLVVARRDALNEAIVVYEELLASDPDTGYLFRDSLCRAYLQWCDTLALDVMAEDQIARLEKAVAILTEDLKPAPKSSNPYLQNLDAVMEINRGPLREMLADAHYRLALLQHAQGRDPAAYQHARQAMVFYCQARPGITSVVDRASPNIAAAGGLLNELASKLPDVKTQELSELYERGIARVATDSPLRPKILGLDPSGAVSLLRIYQARLERRTGRLEAARTRCDEALAAAPEQGPLGIGYTTDAIRGLVQFELAEAAAAENQHEEALRLLAEAEQNARSALAKHHVMTESRQRVDEQLGREPQVFAPPPLIAELSSDFFRRVEELRRRLQPG
jgi:tetratricopeptide (TPR) repeat protein